MLQTRYTSRLGLQERLLEKIKCLYNGDTIIVRNQSKAPVTKTATSVYNIMNVFDRKAKALQRERSAQREDYHLYEYIKEEMGWRTADRVFDIKRTFQTVVELGE